MEGQTQTDVCFSGKLFLIFKEPAEYSPQTKSDPLLVLELSETAMVTGSCAV